MHDFTTLVNEVFVGRMGGPMPTSAHAWVLAKWIDRQPVLRATPEDTDVVARGRLLFESEAVGCGSCHSGPHFTNNQPADVGTGAFLHVPALQGLSFRAPFMHDGCASSRRDRFGACGGGDQHGRTSQLLSSELDDLLQQRQSARNGLGQTLHSAPRATSNAHSSVQFDRARRAWERNLGPETPDDG